jgi:hypothetical protein
MTNELYCNSLRMRGSTCLSTNIGHTAASTSKSSICASYGLHAVRASSTKKKAVKLTGEKPAKLESNGNANRKKMVRYHRKVSLI